MVLVLLVQGDEPLVRRLGLAGAPLLLNQGQFGYCNIVLNPQLPDDRHDCGLELARGGWSSSILSGSSSPSSSA